jgi:5-methylthioadenosine/S-adenosylhomocysteine deaminase
LGILSPHTVLAHCVHVSQDEIGLFAERGVTVAHCPISNLKLAAGIAPVAPMLRAGVRVALGTDSAQSSNDLNLWNDLRLAPILQKTVQGDPTVMPAPRVVRMATCDAARALGLGDKIGSLEEGKCADIIMLDLGAVHSQPLYDVYAQLLYSLGREDVSTVLIDGRIVMQDRQLVTLDKAEIFSRLLELALEISAEQHAASHHG